MQWPAPAACAGLARRCAEDLAPRPIEASDLARWTYVAGSGFEPRRGFAVPWPELATAARAIATTPSRSMRRPLRRHVPFLQIGARALPSLSVATAAIAANVAPDAVRASRAAYAWAGCTCRCSTSASSSSSRSGRLAGTLSRRVLINYRGPAVLPDGVGTVYTEYSALDLLQASEQVQAGRRGRRPGRLPRQDRRRRVTAAGLHDVFTVPFTAAGKMSGAVVHATLVDQLLSSNFVTPARPPARWPPPSRCPCSRPRVPDLVAGGGGLATALLAAAYAGGSHWAFRRGVWLPLVVPWLGAALAAVGGLAWHYFVEGVRSAREAAVLALLVARRLRAAAQGPRAAELGQPARDDRPLLRPPGFTTFTEQGRRGRGEAAQRVPVADGGGGVRAPRHGGQFVGDMVVALFGAPLEDPDHADMPCGRPRHVPRARGAQHALGRGGPAGARRGHRRQHRRDDAGNVGSSRIQSYTVIGDAVNLGARLQALNRTTGPPSSCRPNRPAAHRGV